MKNKTLTRIAVSSLITACLMVQPCYAAEATAETQTTEESDALKFLISPGCL